MSLDKSKVKEFRKDFDTVAKLFETKYGMKLSLGTIHFDSVSLRCTLSGLLADPFGESAMNVTPMPPAPFGATPASKDADAEYVLSVSDTNGRRISISPKGFLGSKYKLPGKRVTYTVTGVNRRAPKYCIEVKTESGARYRMSASALIPAVLVGHE